MPSHTLAERLKNVEGARQTRTARELARLEAEGKPAPAAKVPLTTKKPPVEKRGTGTPSFDLSGTIAKIKAQIARLQGRDPDKEATLLARIAALKANVGK